MAATKEQVLAGLKAVKSPEGIALTDTRKLSDVVVSDGKVFFSITVDAAVVQIWEPVLKVAVAVERAGSNVVCVMVAMTCVLASVAARVTPPTTLAPCS